MLNFENDAASFRAFIQMHQDRVYNAVLNRVQNISDAEEITQDVFIDVFRQPGAFRGEAAVTTWLYRIAMNKCVDHLRRQKRRNRWNVSTWFTGHDNEPGVHPVAADFFHPGIAAENREKAALLFKAMKQLPYNQHTAWVLHEMDNRSYKEISEIMHLSVSSVESLLFRARQHMKKILSGMYPGRET